MKTYRGSPAGARAYVEAGRSRADDYYLTEGTGIADRYAASPVDDMRRLAPLTGDGYEAWIAGYDPDTGTPKGRLRHDPNAVRFVEVVVNGPKSWSLAAELHPEISAAYDAAQERAAQQILAWLAQHATTRVGPRGAQIQVPVQEIEAAVIRHHTSRAGDPHRHLHLQINARVFAEGRWRGLHTVGVRDSLDAINGIGHAAVMTDPDFRAALVAHGFTLDPGTGEVRELAAFVGPFSARAAQIGRHLDRYEAGWRAAHPHEEPGPALRRAWDARAWAEARPDKIVPHDGTELTARWVNELRELGYRDPGHAVPIGATRIGELDRARAVDEVLARVGTRRSAWNAADIRGEIEQLVARRNIVIDSAVRTELAEDLTARALAECVPLLEREGLPEHLRALTSRHVLDVEADLTARLAARADPPTAMRKAVPAERLAGLDATQRNAVTALCSDLRLVVVEGAAGAGKTATLAATRAQLEQAGHHLVVVTPTLKAARVAGTELGSAAFSAAWLAHRHGFRWADDGRWTRLVPGHTDRHTGAPFTGPDPTAALHPGDLLLVDEAGMLDQDTARALLTIADEAGARVALVGDRHQLPAVGRGGVLDVALRWVAPEARLMLDTVHRFTRTIVSAAGSFAIVADDQYAQLSLAMRTSENPAAVFDALLAREQIRVYPTEQDRLHALAERGAHSVTDDVDVVLVADTREQVAALNDAVRDRLVAAGRVDDREVTVTGAGHRIGYGDRVATRRNATELAVANRDIWTVTGVAGDGAITVSGERGQRTLPAGYVHDHVELAYASTAHGVQASTATASHVVVGEHNTAASAYVAMTRGREANIAHLVADTVDDAREQWLAVFARDRADLGPAHAAERAALEASRYARLRPLDEVFVELRDAWTMEADCLQRLAEAEQRRDLLIDIVALSRDRDTVVPPLERAYRAACDSVEHARARVERIEEQISAHAAEIAARLQSDWDAQYDAAKQAAQVVRDGPGRLGQRRGAVNRATEQLARWSAHWQPYLPTMPTRSEDIAMVASWYEHPGARAAFEQYGRAVADHACRADLAAARAAADQATVHRDGAGRAYDGALRRYSLALSHHGNVGHVDDPAGRLATADQLVADLRGLAGAASSCVNDLLAEPAVRVLRSERLTAERDRWQVNRDARERRGHSELMQRAFTTASRPSFGHEPWTPPSPEQEHSIGR